MGRPIFYLAWDNGRMMGTDDIDGFHFAVFTDSADEPNYYGLGKGLAKAFAILNDHWDSPQYAHLNPEPLMLTGDEDRDDQLRDSRYKEGRGILKVLQDDDTDPTPGQSPASQDRKKGQGDE